MLLGTKQMLLTRLWFSFRDTKDTLSDAKNFTNQKRVTKEVIGPSGEHSRLAKEKMTHACGWITLGI